jgi:hypothetical protein
MRPGVASEHGGGLWKARRLPLPTEGSVTSATPSVSCHVRSGYRRVVARWERAQKDVDRADGGQGSRMPALPNRLCNHLR